MNPLTTLSKIIHKEKAQSFDIKYTIIHHINLPNDYILVLAHNKMNTDLVKMFDKSADLYSKFTQTSVPLTAAIASYARISMFLKCYLINEWYYSDTDSIVLENELDQESVSANELGKMKMV